MPTPQFQDLANRCGEWLRGSGPQSEIVMSSRIRLARNLAEFPFIRRCTGSDRLAIEKQFQDAIASVGDWKALLFSDVAALPTVDRQLLAPPRTVQLFGQPRHQLYERGGVPAAGEGTGVASRSGADVENGR